MRTVHSYDYASIRVVPSAERGEFINAGVILHCAERAFLKSVVHVDERRLLRDLVVSVGHRDDDPFVQADDDLQVGPIGQRVEEPDLERTGVVGCGGWPEGLRLAPAAASDKLFFRVKHSKFARLILRGVVLCAC